ncbi:MAG TPA: hypothetical protein VF749_18645 [Candidatus Acidoferrum sp.]
MSLDADARLAAAAGGVARFFADAAGLETDAGARWQSAVLDACKEAFKHLGAKHPHLEVTFARFSDRIEVALSHEEDAPGFDRHATASFAEKTGSAGNSETPAGVDCVQHETHGREVVTRLTKYLRQVAPSV